MAECSVSDEVRFMREAIRLAKSVRGHTRPNPAVGAVVVKDGCIVGRGRHVKCGEAHAEVAALEDAASNGVSAEGASVYVTLEPCSKPGRVGACCDALIAAKVAKVVWAVPDPNPKNADKAAEVLRGAGIKCECWLSQGDVPRHICARDAAKIVAPFAKHVTTGLPFVTVKIAMTLDGRICDDTGAARWISSDKARKRTGALRNAVDAIMVGAETVRKDNPRLLCYGHDNLILHRVVVTRSAELPENTQILTDEAADRTIVFKIGGADASPTACKDAVPATDLKDMMKQLGEKGFMHILCEGGLELATSLAKEGLVDEWVTVLVPKVIGHESVSDAVEVPGASVYCDLGMERSRL